MGRQISRVDISAALGRVGPSRQPMERNSLGTRNTETRFRELICSSQMGLVLHPESLFHLKKLHRNLLLQLLVVVVLGLERVILALEAISRPPIPLPPELPVCEGARLLQLSAEIPGASLSLEVAQGYATETAASIAQNFLGDLPTADEGRQILLNEMSSLLANISLLVRGLHFLASTDGVDFRIMRQCIMPSLAADLSLVLDGICAQVGAGVVLEDPAARIAELMAVPATLRAVANARSPLEPLVQPRNRTLEEEGPYPRGSSLALQAAGPVAPATLTTTRTPGGFPVDATFLYTPNGAAQRTVLLKGSGRYRIESRPLVAATYTITVGQLLVSFNGVLFSLGVPTGSQSIATVASALAASAAALGLNLTVSGLGNRLYLISTQPLALSPSGLVPDTTLLKTDGLTFPLAAIGETLALRLTAYGQPAETRYHVVTSGLFTSIATIIAELAADTAFSAGLVYADVGGTGTKLSIEYTAPGVTKLEVVATPAALPFSLPIVLGATSVPGSAAEELGFEPTQSSTRVYTSAQIVSLLEQGETSPPAVVAKVEEGPLIEGTGSLTLVASEAHLSDPSKDFIALGVKAGDYAVVQGFGRRYLLSVGTTSLNLGVIPGGFRAGLAVNYEVSYERITITSTATDLTSSIVVGAGTANAGMGVVAGTYEPESTDYEIVGTLAGEETPRTISPEVLGVPDGAEIDIAGSTIRSAALTQFRTLQEGLRRVEAHEFFQYLISGDLLLETVNEASRLEGLKNSRMQEAQRQLVAILNLLDPASPGRPAVLSSLQRVGTLPPAVPSPTLKGVLAGYAPVVAPKDVAVASSILLGLREHGYDRAADMVVQARFIELEGLTGESASKAGRVTAALSSVSRRLQDRTAGRS